MAKALAGKPYRPSNGTEGAAFDDAFCSDCARDRKYRETNDGKDGCPILAAALIHNPGEPGYPKEWIYDADDYGMCTAFTDVEPPPPDHPGQSHIWPD